VTKPVEYAVVKDRCSACNRVVYGYMPLNVELDPPVCSKCKKKAAGS